MNRTEAFARPYLTKMAEGANFALETEGQVAVARWVAAKLMVAEHAPKAVPTTPRSDRRKMAESQEIPAYFRIYGGAHRLKSEIGFFRSSGFASIVGRPAPELDGMVRNIQHATFLLGKAFFHIDAVRLEEFSIEDNFKFPIVHKLGKLWPKIGEKRYWPGGVILEQQQFTMLFNSFALASSNMHPSFDGPIWV